MMNFGKVFLLGAVAVALAACGGMDLGKAKGVAPKGKAFDQHLYVEYLTLSQEEYDEADYGNSDIFAQRAIAAGSGTSPAPEEIAARHLPAGTVGDLTAARGRLVAAFGKGATEKMPQPAAHAQAMFECWMEEQEENNQPKDIAACRAEFEAAMAQIEAAPKPAPAPMAAKPAPQPMAMPGPFMLYFDFDSAELTPVAKSVVGTAAAAIAKANSVTVVVSGYTDRAGSDKYNLALSKKRAQVVAAALKAAGVKADIKMVIASLGEMEPQVPTADGKREAKNRRVSIVLN